MPKKKKTREQKIRSEHRRETTPSPLYSLSPESLPIQAKAVITPSVKHQTTIVTSSYHYLAADLRKTAFFTGSIIFLELALRFIIKI